MIKKSIFIITLIAGVCSGLSGQNLTDALRYSYLIPGGTSRVLGVGGAFGAMGGDFGVVGTNVSGIADFRSSEILISTSYNTAAVESLLNDNTIGTNNQGREFILENIAYVSHNKPIGRKLSTSNFAIGFQQYANYNQVISFDVQSRGSITDRWADLANFDLYDDFEAGLADQAGAIFFDEFIDAYTTDLLPGEEVSKEQIIERSGRFNELSFAWAGKFKSGLNVGVGIGIPFISYEEDKFYEENDTDGLPTGFNRLNFNQNLTISGTGFNLKAGLGYSLVLVSSYNRDSLKVNRSILRFGLGFQTPTYFRLSDSFRNSIQYDCELCLQPDVLFESPDGFFDYRLRTPYRLTGSIGTLLNFGPIKGFVNFDAQYLDYRKNQFNLTANSDNPEDALFESEVNGEINNELRSAINYNLGTELVYNRWRLRAGVSLLQAPFDEQGTGANEFDNVFAAGFGYRANSFYVDLGFQTRKLDEGYRPYQTGDVNTEINLTNKTDIKKVILTLGFKL